MKILTFSDLHGSAKHAAALVAASGEADLVIGAGDFCNMRQGLDEAMALLTGITAPFVIVPGNAESYDELRAAVPATVEVLHGTATTIDGLRLFGLGGAVPETPFGDWSWDISEDQATGLLNTCDDTDILIFHSPPKGVVDSTSAGQSVGSVAIYAAIERIQPRLALCGHIHDSWRQDGLIGTTKVHNLGPFVRWFEVDN
jgi:Icc-related predicted phosphoesterase